jgi:hypothetical protein
LRTESSEWSGQLSPDNRWMAYTSDESGHDEVYIRSFPSADGQQRISLDGGDQPRWRGDGKDLFFVALDGTMMGVPVRAGAGSNPSLELGAPLPLFETHMVRVQFLYGYDVMADGKRFLINSATNGLVSAPPLNVAVNWDTGFKK